MTGTFPNTNQTETILLILEIFVYGEANNLLFPCLMIVVCEIILIYDIRTLEGCQSPGSGVGGPEVAPGNFSHHNPNLPRSYPGISTIVS